MMSDYDVVMADEDSTADFFVRLKGPKETAYEAGEWKVHVSLPKEYPYKSPSIGFINKIYHPNVDEASGSVCLDVINQTWSPMFGTHVELRNSCDLAHAADKILPHRSCHVYAADLVNVFSIFLPQLLRYPNPKDPLNGEAAAMLMRDPKKYNLKVRAHVKLHASNTINLKSKGGEDGDESDAGSEFSDLSDVSDMSDDDDECTGIAGMDE
eukprot:g48.t1